MSNQFPKASMVLAAGLGRRMLPLTVKRPKPLIKLAGKHLIDRTLDHLASVRVETAIVNLHYESRKLFTHLKDRKVPRIVFSDESKLLLGTGGGVAHALPLLGKTPFFVVNGDVVWLDGIKNTLRRLAMAWDDTSMDGLLLLQAKPKALGYNGPGDYRINSDGRLRRRQHSEKAPYVFAGIQILHPNLFDGCKTDPFPLTELYDRAEMAGRLFGVCNDGIWMHVGSPEGLALAESVFRKL